MANNPSGNTLKTLEQRRVIAEIDLRKIIETVLKNWYWFPISTLICLIVAFINLKCSPEQFEVRAGILLRQSEKMTAGQVDDITMLEAIGSNGSMKEVSDEIEILTSKTLIHRMIDTLGIHNEYHVRQGWQWQELYYDTPLLLVSNSPSFNDTIGQTQFFVCKKDEKYKITVKRTHHSTQTVYLAEITEPFMTFAGAFRFVPTGKKLNKQCTYRITVNNTYALIDQLSSSINVRSANKKSNVISISTVSPCRQKSKDMLNMLVDLYNQDAIKDKNQRAITTKNFVDGRVKLIENELFNVEKEEEDYKKSNDLTDIQTDSKLYLQLASDYEKERVRLESQMGMIKYLDDFVRDEENPYALLPAGIILESQKSKRTTIPGEEGNIAVSSGALIPSGSGIENSALSAMIKEHNDLIRQRTTLLRSANENNPVITEINQQLKILKGNIISSIASTQKSIEIALNDVVTKDRQFRAKIQNIPMQTRIYRELVRQRDIKEMLYLFLLKRQEEMELSLANTLPPAKTIDRAYILTSPVAPRRKMTWLFALFFGLCAPAAVLYAKNLLNNKIERQEEIKKNVVAPLIGTIVQNKGKETLVVHSNDTSAIAEQFRMLGTNLQFLFAGNQSGSKIVMLTSAGSSEGKSFCALNLAAALVQTKKKTVLVELDIRNPCLCEYTGIDSKNTGVSLYLADENRMLSSIVRTVPAVPNLDFVPCGPVPPNPAELLAGDRINQLFDELRAKYEYIIVDTAPVGMVSDTFVMNKNADVSIWVIRSEHTSKDTLTAVNELYESKKLKNLAILFNGIDNRSSSYATYRRAKKQQG